MDILVILQNYLFIPHYEARKNELARPSRSARDGVAVRVLRHDCKQPWCSVRTRVSRTPLSILHRPAQMGSATCCRSSSSRTHARHRPSLSPSPPLSTHTHTHSEFLSGNYSDLRMLNPDLPLLMRASVAVEPAIVAHTSESRYAYSRAAIAHTHSHIAPRSRRHPLSLSLVAFRLGCTEAHRPCG